MLEVYRLASLILREKGMERWIRTERWILAVIGVFLTATVAFAVWPREIEPPVSGLDKPIFVNHGRASTRIVYEVDQPYFEAWRDLDVKLQIKGFKGPNVVGNWGAYRRNRRESVRLYQGTWQQKAMDKWGISLGNGSKTTVVHTIYRDSWWRVWRKVNRDWQWHMQEKQRLSRSSSP
ncbi:MAG: hypothetical protein H7Y17_17775 [Chlorobia bacterium]|nr:hypothetical protein [Fimbriimonadaceae bacterium]